MRDSAGTVFSIVPDCLTASNRNARTNERVSFRSNPSSETARTTRVAFGLDTRFATFRRVDEFPGDGIVMKSGRGCCGRKEITNALLILRDGPTAPAEYNIGAIGQKMQDTFRG